MKGKIGFAIPSFLFFCAQACDPTTGERQELPGERKAVASAASAPAAVTPSRCKVSSSFALRGGSAGGAPGAAAGAVLIGEVRGALDGFAVGTLGPERETRAGVAFMPPDLARTKEIDLGVVHGDVPPPAVFAHGDGVYFALADMDAGGGTLRVGHTGVTDTPQVRWGLTQSDGKDASRGFDLAVLEERGALVWDAWYNEGARGLILGATFDAATLQLIGKPVALTGSETDAEGPRLRAAQHGYWLAYFSAANEQAGVEILKLDRSLNALGPPLLVVPRDASVDNFGLYTAGDGSALVVWRDQTTLEGAGGRIGATLVGVDGAQRTDFLDAGRLAAGRPEFALAAASGGWLFASDLEENALLGWMEMKGGPGLAGLALREESALGRGTLLAANAGVLLFAEQTAERTTVSAASCQP